MLSMFAQTAEKFNKFHDKPVLAVKFSPDGKLFASICADKTIRIWNTENGELVNTLSDKLDGDVAIDFSPDGTFLVSGSWDKTVKVWDVQSGKTVDSFIGHDKALRAVDIDGSGQFVVSAGWDLDIKIWHFKSGVNLKTMRGHTQCIRAVKFNPAGTKLATGGYDLVLKLWDVNKGIATDSVKAHKYPIETLDYSPDGTIIATGSADNLVKLWNSETLAPIATLKGHSEGIFSVSFSPDGRYLASASNDKTIRIWSIDSKKQIKVFHGHTLSVKSVDFSPNGKSLVSGSTDKSVRVWNVEDLNIKTPTPIPPDVAFAAVDNAVSWVFPDEARHDVLKRELKIRFRLNNNELNDFRLFINQAEYAEYDGKTKYLVKPNVLSDKDSPFKELEYDVYLNMGENSIQLYAGNESGSRFGITEKRVIYCHDFSNMVISPKMFVYVVNIPNYSDKKINAGFSTFDKRALTETLLEQEGKMYREIVIFVQDAADNTTKEAMLKNLKEMYDKSKEGDLFLFVINGQTAIDGDKPYLLPQNFTEKTSLKEALCLDDLTKYMKLMKCQSATFYINNQLLKSKALKQPTDENLSKYFEKRLVAEDNKAIFIFRPNGKDDAFNQIVDALGEKNDVDQNQMIEISEIARYMENHMEATVIEEGIYPPVMIHFKKDE